MASYVYMKILESQPNRYDRGISWLSLGHCRRIKRRIVNELVRPGSRVLDIGCGTGSLAVLAASQDARVTGFDVSEGMLSVGRKKAASEGLADRIELLEFGIAGMDTFDDATFDLVVSTLVFSELSQDERTYALRHAYRVLKPDGRLAIADEVRPETLGKRVLYGAIRVPLRLGTFLLTQTTTTPVAGLKDLVSQAGFRIESVERNTLESFLYLVAVKEDKRQ